ncbi:MAG TPA: hypothetical protein VGK19_19960 [Capsulimonadaceae bacterium]
MTPTSPSEEKSAGGNVKSACRLVSLLGWSQRPAGPSTRLVGDGGERCGIDKRQG